MPDAILLSLFLFAALAAGSALWAAGRMSSRVRELERRLAEGGSHEGAPSAPARLLPTPTQAPSRKPPSIKTALQSKAPPSASPPPKKPLHPMEKAALVLAGAALAMECALLLSLGPSAALSRPAFASCAFLLFAAAEASLRDPARGGAPALFAALAGAFLMASLPLVPAFLLPAGCALLWAASAIRWGSSLSWAALGLASAHWLLQIHGLPSEEAILFAILAALAAKAGSARPAAALLPLLLADALLLSSAASQADLASPLRAAVLTLLLAFSPVRAALHRPALLAAAVLPALLLPLPAPDPLLLVLLLPPLFAGFASMGASAAWAAVPALAMLLPLVPAPLLPASPVFPLLVLAAQVLPVASASLQNRGGRSSAADLILALVSAAASIRLAGAAAWPMEPLPYLSALLLAAAPSSPLRRPAAAGLAAAAVLSAVFPEARLVAAAIAASPPAFLLVRAAARDPKSALRAVARRFSGGRDGRIEAA